MTELDQFIARFLPPEKEYKKFALRDVRPNPFRDLTRFPLVQSKLDSLVESMRETDSWDNIVGRETGEGKLEIASGHHRLAAAIEVYGIDDVRPFIVRDLSDSVMLQMMSRENDETYVNDISSVIESVRAAVITLAEGRIPRGHSQGEMPNVARGERERKDTHRYAPSFVAGRVPEGADPQRIYNAHVLAKYLGCTRKGGSSGEQADPRINTALAALEGEELGIIGFDQIAINSLKPEDSRKLLTERVFKSVESAKFKHRMIIARSARKAEEAKRAAESLKERLDRIAQEKKEREDESNRLMKERMDAVRHEAEEKAAQLKKQMLENERRRKAADEKHKQLLKEYREAEKERAASKRAQEEAKAKNAARQEAQRHSRHVTGSQKVDRLLDADALHQELKGLLCDKAVTKAECKMHMDALARLSERAAMLRGKWAAIAAQQ